MNADAKADMQDICYSAMHHREFATSEEMLAALMPHVERYVAAELNAQADHLDGYATVLTPYGAELVRDVAAGLRVRANELRAQS